MNSEMPIKVLLADDHPIVMSGFAMSLTSHNIEVIGEAKTPAEALQMYFELMPDVVLLDVRFGEKLTGIDIGKTIIEKHPEAKIIFLSQFDQDFLIRETYKLGARAFITKDCDEKDLAEAVFKAYEGALYFLPNIAQRLASLSLGEDNSPQSLLEGRELEVFMLMAKGFSNVEIVEKTGLATKTISNIGHIIRTKLGVNRSADLTLLAVMHGYIDPIDYFKRREES